MQTFKVKRRKVVITLAILLSVVRRFIKVVKEKRKKKEMEQKIVIGEDY